MDAKTARETEQCVMTGAFEDVCWETCQTYWYSIPGAVDEQKSSWWLAVWEGNVTAAGNCRDCKENLRIDLKCSLMWVTARFRDKNGAYEQSEASWCYYCVLNVRMSKPNRDLHRLPIILVASQCRKHAWKWCKTYSGEVDPLHAQTNYCVSGSELGKGL